MPWFSTTARPLVRLGGVLALCAAAVVAMSVLSLAPARSASVRVRASSDRSRAGAVPAAGPVVTVNPAQPGRVIPAGFLGLSFEYWALENYAGKNPRALNPVFVRLTRQLVNPGSAVVRIGGVTTDQTWWPVPGMATPGGVKYTLNQDRLAVAKSLARSMGARLIMGVNFEANSLAVARAEVQAMQRYIGGARIAAFELGNEPDLYGGLPWYTKNGVGVLGRPAGWGYASLNQNYASIAAGMSPQPLAGPSIGTLSWMPDLSDLLTAVPQIRLVSLHRYPLQGCTVPPSNPDYPTIAHLLADSASVAQAQDLAPYVAIAHSRGLPVRNDEMNTVACGNVRGVAETFASALWAMDASFQMAAVGLDGINIHTAPGYSDQLFSFSRSGSRWRGQVAPEYYGLLMFSRALPRGARLLPVSGATSTLRAWATKAPNGRIRVLLINEASHPQTLRLNVGGGGTAVVQRLKAPGVRATGHITIAGQAFARNTATGQLTGHFTTILLHRRGGAFAARLPGASAELLTLR